MTEVVDTEQTEEQYRQDQPAPMDSPALVAVPDVIITLSKVEKDLNVEMHLPHGGEPDLDNPAHFFMVWMAHNWEHLSKLAAVAFNESKDSRDPSKVTDVEVKEPTAPTLVGTDGEPLVQSN